MAKERPCPSDLKGIRRISSSPVWQPRFSTRDSCPAAGFHRRRPRWSWPSSCCAIRAIGVKNDVAVFSGLHRVAGRRFIAALEKSFGDEEDGTARRRRPVDLFVSEAQLQASVAFLLMVGVVGCVVHPRRARVACRVYLDTAAQHWGQIMAADGSEYHLDTRVGFSRFFREVIEIISPCCAVHFVGLIPLLLGCCIKKGTKMKKTSTWAT